MRQISNPPNPWSSQQREWLEEPPRSELRVFEEEAKSIISTFDSPDLSFRHSVNPYRGCTHACSYCYARPSHQYLGFGAGTDFDTQIIAKVNAPKLLRLAFEKKSWRGEVIFFSGNTDCYQALEASYQLTRQMLEVCLEYQQPVSLITKSPLIQRDLPLLKKLNEEARLHVTISLAFLDPEKQRLAEPGAPPPKARLAALRALSEAGISTGLGLAPIIPGLNDDEVASILIEAKKAGARCVFKSLVRLPTEVEDVFISSLRQRFPTQAEKVLGRIRAARGGKLNESPFGERMTGKGPAWAAIDQLFYVTCKKIGLTPISEEAGLFEEFKVENTTFKRPGEQLDLL